MKYVILHSFIIILLGGFFTHPAHSQENDCYYYKDYIEEALRLQSTGASLSEIQNKIKIQDKISKQLLAFIKFSIDEATNQPEYMRQSLDNGVWIAACENRIK